ncbi:FH2 domain-containing protein 1-like [Salvelinus namaycush]|uniref:FH2 domain-containing protein 1-like n=1 Tax=Salvelinus namaycush TaxID=8040 RepID=A0A8U0U6M4_SALNM|nr:FH2 domain-containing protein 1-like [Salvelinus namaycush]
MCWEAVKKDQSLLSFPGQLGHVGPASRLCEELVVEDLSRLHSRLVSLRISVQTEAEIQQLTRSFLEVAEERLKEAEDEVEGMRMSSQALVEFFCEDDSIFKLEEACRVFHSFCLRFQRAVQENAEREQKEQKWMEREREMVEKRRSVAVCTGLDLGVVLGRVSPLGTQKNQDDLERTLENLSHTWSQRSLRSQENRRHSHHLQNYNSHLLQNTTSAPLQTNPHLNNSSNLRNTSIHPQTSPGLPCPTYPSQERPSLGTETRTEPLVRQSPGLVGAKRPNHEGTTPTQVSQTQHELTSNVTQTQCGRRFNVPQNRQDIIAYVTQTQHGIATNIIESRLAPTAQVTETHHERTVDASPDQYVLTTKSMASPYRHSSTTTTAIPSVRRNTIGIRHRYDLEGTDPTPVSQAKHTDTSVRDAAHQDPDLAPLTGSTVTEVTEQPFESQSKSSMAIDAPDGVQLQESKGAKETTQGSGGALELRLSPEGGTTQQRETESRSTPVEQRWLPTSLPELSPQRAHQCSEVCSPDRERDRSYPRVGETLECHTLVRGLRSYDNLSPPPTTPLPKAPPSLCSKWRKERQAETPGAGAGLPMGKEDSRSGGNTPVVRGGAKRGLVPRARLPNDTGIHRARLISKPETQTPTGPVPNPNLQTTPRSTRLASPSIRSASIRSSPITRPTTTQTEVKRSSSTRSERSQAGGENQQLVPGKPTLTRRVSERAGLGLGPERERTSSTSTTSSTATTQPAFVRGSPLRVTKRLAPTSNSETQHSSQPRSTHSPSATAKTIRTAIIAAARTKTAKTSPGTEPSRAAVSACKTPTATRIPGPKMDRPASSPMWK